MLAVYQKQENFLLNIKPFFHQPMLLKNIPVQLASLKMVKLSFVKHYLNQNYFFSQK